MEIKKAVIYCRVSTKEQVDEGNSIVTQEKACREYALKNQYEVVEIFLEKGESAKTANRPELRKMLDFCKVRKNSISVVIAYKIDRISRNIDDYSFIRILLRKLNIEIRSTTETIEDTPAGKFMENMIANVAQFDNDVRTERCVNGMREAVREGRYIWLAPVGYTNVKLFGKATIQPDRQASIIKWVFNEVAVGNRSIESIYFSACQKGLVTRRGKLLSRAYFYTILKNELYCGWINRFGERQKGSFDNLISEELFKHVQYLLGKRKKTSKIYAKNNPDFPLRRFIQHPNGTRLTGGWSRGRRKKYAYYYFKKLGTSYPKLEVENSFGEFLNKYAIKEEHFDRLKKACIHEYKSQLVGAQNNRILLEKSIETLLEKQNAIIEKNLAGNINDRIMTDQLNRIEDEIAKKKSILLSMDNPDPEPNELLPFLRNLLINPYQIWKKASIKGKTEFQWFNFPKGVSFDGTKFRTAELSLLMNVRKAFQNEMFNVVPHSKKTLNTPEMTISKTKELFEETLKLQNLLNSDSTNTSRQDGLI